ncbi:hypothetical protein PENTCL1PPCAC_15474, partial [Pristionchus entomophagus]
VETISLIFGSLMKEIFLGYRSALLSILAMDRLTATKAWAWYERGTYSTLLFFVLQEAIIFSISITIAHLLVYEFITGMQAVYCYAILVLVGTSFLSFVYRLNLREVRIMRQGAVVHRYSISRTYQIMENIAMLTKMSVPLVVVCLPPFIFFPIFDRVPPNIGYVGIRFFSASMYDLWLSM